MAETTWDSASTVSYYLGFVSIIFRPRAPVKCSSASSASLVHCDESGVTSFSSRPLLPSYPACLPRHMTHRWHAARPAIPECSAEEFAAGGWNSSSSLLPACLSHSVVLWLLALLLWHTACLISLRPLFKVMASETIGLWDQMAFGCPADRAVH